MHGSPEFNKNYENISKQIASESTDKRGLGAAINHVSGQLNALDTGAQNKAKTLKVKFNEKTAKLMRAYEKTTEDITKTARGAVQPFVLAVKNRDKNEFMPNHISDFFARHKKDVDKIKNGQSA